ncbi:MAG TPA: NADP-dependent oxidoreductase [Acidimicrobiia bacterium]|nr:NADP-dependent oxidoreductase [Acidimicrobiia bacterium]
MRAITVSEFGPPSVLQPAEVPTPTPGPGAVLVEVTGAGVGPWDTKQRSGAFGPNPFPYIPGFEVSGLVAAVGDNAGRFPLGTSVFGRPELGGYAEYAVVKLDELAALPPQIDLEAAGAAPIGACTALEGLHDHLHLAAGESVLVAGAAGGVGAFVVQFAKAAGARVIGTASEANRDFLLQLGADEVLDYRSDWVPAATGVDAAFDLIGGPTWSQCLAAVRDGGRAVTVHPSEDATRAGVTTSTFNATVTTARLEETARLCAAGARIEIFARLPLDDAARAHELIEDGHTRGKVVLIPG